MKDIHPIRTFRFFLDIILFTRIRDSKLLLLQTCCILCGYKVYRRVNCIYHSHDTVEVLRRLLLAEEARGHGTTVTVCDGRLPRDIKVHPEFAGTMRESGAVKFISE